MSQQRTKDVARTALEILDRHGTVGNKLLFGRIESEHSNLGGREYSEALMQLSELNLVRSFDGSQGKTFEVTRQGSCMLADDS